MSTADSILIVDDEVGFCQSTAELFRRDGYACDCASDADEALEKLKTNQYDVLISDIKMPGNPDLRLLRQMQQLSPATPVILVTGYPSVDSAISAISLSVVAYLKKPVDLAELRAHVQNSVQRSRSHRTVSHVRRLLQRCVHDLEDIEREQQLSKAAGGQAGAAIQTGTIQALIACLSELLNLEAASGSRKTVENVCEVVNCPQGRIYRKALLDAIEVLKETKNRFKSKGLANLRTRLESVLEGSETAYDRAEQPVPPEDRSPRRLK